MQRFLNDEPIVARSPSAAYRLAKFADRNRVAVTASGVILVLLAGGIITTTRMALVARNSARQAEDARQNLQREVEQKKSTLRMLAEASYQEAVAAALAGDPEKAEAAMKIACEAGISSIDVSVLKGVIELNRGHFDKAVAYADEALAVDHTLLPASRSIGPLALLGAASPWSGHIDRFEEAINRLAPLAPRSDTEYLLKAYAMVLPDPYSGVRLLEAEPRIQHSPVGLLIRGMSQLFMGIDRKDPDLLDNAIGDFEYVHFLFRDNQAAVGWRTYAIAAALELARLQERREDELRLTEVGRVAVQELSALQGNAMNSNLLYHAYRAIGDVEKSLAASREAASFAASFCGVAAIAFLAHYEPPIAAQQFERALPDQFKETE
jgi:tetratricopeptide (TPR) repeat protein